MPETLVINGVTYVTLEAAQRMASEAQALASPPEPWVTVAEAARLAHRDRRAVRAAIAAGDLDARIPNGCVRGLRVKRASLERWMEGRAPCATA